MYPGSGLTGTISDKITLTAFGVHGKYMLPMPESPLHPYVVAGFGMGQFKEKFETDNYPEEIETDNELSYRGGLGATWRFNDQFGLNGEANYRSMQTEGEASNSIGFDVGFTWSIPMAAKWPASGFIRGAPPDRSGGASRVRGAGSRKAGGYVWCDPFRSRPSSAISSASTRVATALFA